MRRDPEKYFWNMLDSCQFVLELTTGKSIEDYKGDRVFRSAIERELQIIGEALMQLKFRNPEAAAKVLEYEKIIRFRHVLVHGYEDIRPDYVWEVITQKLPPLRTELKTLIQQHSLFDQDKKS
jgi:uncharacterized protein with HEPN domain